MPNRIGDLSAGTPATTAEFEFSITGSSGSRKVTLANLFQVPTPYSATTISATGAATVGSSSADGSGTIFTIKGGSTSGVGALKFSNAATTTGWEIGRDNVTSGDFVFTRDGVEKGRYASTGLTVTGVIKSSVAAGNAIGVAASPTTNLNLAASVAGVSPLRIAHGTAPSAPVDGDIWTTTAGLFVRINGVTVGPLS